jgi:hypothetical protein
LTAEVAAGGLAADLGIVLEHEGRRVTDVPHVHVEQLAQAYRFAEDVMVAVSSTPAGEEPDAGSKVAITDLHFP